MEGKHDSQATGVLEQIIGARLTSVCFVMDYVRLGFDKTGSLTFLVWPDIVDSQGVAISFGNSSFGDRLCNLIKQVVVDVQVVRDETMTIGFESGIKLLVRLRDSPHLLEKAIFNGPRNELEVW
jgi:hypothetical protein